MSPTLDAVLRSWPFEPGLLVGLLLTACVYLRGWLLLHRRKPQRWHGGRLAAFLGGLTTIYVALRLTARTSGQVLEYPATSEAATNKLLQAAVFDLPEAGWWDVEVDIDGPHGPAQSQFAVEAGRAPPRWLDLWPWFAWPAFAVALFALHQWLARKRPPKA